MANIVRTVIQFRRDVTANWEANKTVVPAAGEPCYDTELHMLKIGDGTTTYENLPAIGGVNVTADGKSLVFTDGVFKLYGFDAAETGAQPRKKDDGTLEWVVAPSAETVKGLQTAVEKLQANVKTLQDIVTPTGEGTVPLLDRVAAIEGAVTGTGEGSVDAKIDDKLKELMGKVSDDGTVNTIKELIDYVADHGKEAADMAADITSLKDLVGETSVDSRILDAITKTETKAKALFEHVKYEISNKPVNTQVDYRDKEIRVLCPADTQFEVQAVGPTGDPSKYYIGFKAYAPDGAVSFKEDLGTVITDDTMYYFNDDFAGTDVYGRNYSIVWLPVAKHNDDDTWTYYGANSSAAKYIGWHYSVEWYGADGKVIASDTIRINLANEDCYRGVEPYYMANVVKGVKVNGALLEMVDGKVDIKTNDIIKTSDEFTIAEDGTIGIGTISITKITQSDEEEFILDGGGAAR